MKQIGKSIRDKLYNIAARQGINYQHLLIRYFHERFLYRLSESGYRKNFYLKGGTLLYAFNTAEQQRYTLDMDFSLHKMSYEMKIVEGAVKDICRIEINDGVRFDGKTLNTRLIKENNVYGGIRIINCFHQEILILSI
jgi:predicted nucleotidyltransferase component of viral defense system